MALAATAHGVSRGASGSLFQSPLLHKSIYVCACNFHLLIWNSSILDKWKLLKALLNLVTIDLIKSRRLSQGSRLEKLFASVFFRRGRWSPCLYIRSPSVILSNSFRLFDTSILHDRVSVFICKELEICSLQRHPEPIPAMSGYDDNQGWGDDISHGYQNSSLRKDEIENLADRTDISEEEKSRRKKKLEEEIAAGVVGGGILGYAGYHFYEKHEAKEGEEGA